MADTPEDVVKRKRPHSGLSHLCSLAFRILGSGRIMLTIYPFWPCDLCPKVNTAQTHTRAQACAPSSISLAMYGQAPQEKSSLCTGVHPSVKTLSLLALNSEMSFFFSTSWFHFLALYSPKGELILFVYKRKDIL